MLLLTLLFSSPVKAELNAFACEPEWGSLLEELGGEQVKLFVATTAYQDPHYIQARPSLLAKIRKAELLVCTGSELEIGWLPLLLRRAGAKIIQSGEAGHFMASEFIKNKLEIPEILDRSLGDIHKEGNPHVHLNPFHLLTIAKHLSARLKTIDPENSAYYEARLTDFSNRWTKSIKHWEQQAQALKGKKAIVYHKSFSYMLDWLGIEILADLEPKPGVPPGNKHLATVLEAQNADPAEWVIFAPYQSEKPVNWLKKHSELSALELPYTVGGNAHASDLFLLYQQHIDLLINASK